MSDSQGFEPGTLVRLKSQPDACGAVIAVDSSGPEIKYTVLLDGKTRSFFQSQLIPDETDSDAVPKLSADECRALLTARYINHPGTSTLYSLNAARIDFVAYQFRPVLRFIRADRPRLLIADGVGVGKTIEAGLILKELQARQEINSVMIVCPRPLITEKKWRTEMKRFDQDFEHFDGPLLRHCISECDLDGEWPENHRFGIIPYSILNGRILHGSDNGRTRSQPSLLDLDPAPRFDLVIVDEAHHVANPDTYSYEAVRFFCDNAEAVVFLTATPLQLGNNDLFTLLNLLRPDVVIDRGSFEHISEPNPMINAAASLARRAPENWQAEAHAQLDAAQATPWGRRMLLKNPDVESIKEQLTGPPISDHYRVRMINQLENLHTFSGIVNRTRRRDIADFTIRRPETVEVEFTDEQRELHDALLKVQAEIFTELHGSMYVKFMLTTIRRQAASCLFGLAPFIEDILSRYVSEEELSEVDLDEDFAADPDELETIAEKVKAVIAMAKNLNPVDPKLQAAVSLVEQKQNREEHDNHRVMIFSTFRHTLRYLDEGLRNAGVRVGMIHGGVPDEERTALRERFEKSKDDPDAVDVLLFSEVGCEGLDYQFCDCMINYDLPWNPMRVEQRIGRIDRNGQKSEFVNIYNLITPDTVDADIYERCLMRIGVFNQALGFSEEILGRITNDIQNIAINPELSDEERRKKLQQLADNEIRHLEEEERFEKDQSELFGIHLTQQRIEEEVENASSYWLEPAAMNNLLSKYLAGIDGSATILGENPLKTLRANEYVRKQMLHDARRLIGKNTTSQRDWEKWLKGNEPHLPITFDGQCANDNRSAQLLTPVHPLIRQAAKALDSVGQVEVHLCVNDPDLVEGVHPFAVFQWELIGLRRDLDIRAITKDNTIDARWLSLLQTAENYMGSEDRSVARSDIEELESRHYEVWKDALSEYRSRVTSLAKFKEESLNASHRGRIAMLQDRLTSATEERILRMRQSEIDRAVREYNERLSNLKKSSEQADITTERVLIGTIEITRG